MSTFEDRIIDVLMDQYVKNGNHWPALHEAVRGLVASGVITDTAALDRVLAEARADERSKTLIEAADIIKRMAIHGADADASPYETAAGSVSRPNGPVLKQGKRYE